MKQMLKAEQVTQFILAVGAIYYQPVHIAWWLWLPLFLAPDLGMTGYLVNNRVGAYTYNLLHHKSVAGIAIAIGVLCSSRWLLLAGLLLWAHSSFDRMLGYGWKYVDSFHNTHLGKIGHKS